MRVVYSQDAKLDVQRLWFFIASKSQYSAINIITNLADKIESLSSFPKLGFPVEAASFEHEIRELLVHDYVIRYSIEANIINILRIWHGKENQRNETINEEGAEYKL